MGCTSSKKQKQTQIGEDLFNKDADVRKKLLTGFQMSKDVDGIEANFQIAFWKKTRKKYEKVASAPPPPIEEQPKLEIEEEYKKFFFERCLPFEKSIHMFHKSHCVILVIIFRLQS